MLKRLITQVYYVDDLAVAKKWLLNVFAVEPYFDEPFYVGFNIGGSELGLIPEARPKSNNQVAYWQVDNIEQIILNITQKGVVVAEAIEDVGEGIKVATILDPFGNHFGLIENPHYQKEL